MKILFLTLIAMFSWPKEDSKALLSEVADLVEKTEAHCLKLHSKVKPLKKANEETLTQWFDSIPPPPSNYYDLKKKTLAYKSSTDSVLAYASLRAIKFCQDDDFFQLVIQAVEKGKGLSTTAKQRLTQKIVLTSKKFLDDSLTYFVFAQSLALLEKEKFITLKKSGLNRLRVLQMNAQGFSRELNSTVNFSIQKNDLEGIKKAEARDQSRLPKLQKEVAVLLAQFEK